MITVLPPRCESQWNVVYWIEEMRKEPLALLDCWTEATAGEDGGRGVSRDGGVDVKELETHEGKARVVRGKGRIEESVRQW